MNNDIDCAIDPDLVLFFNFEAGSGQVIDRAISGTQSNGTLMGSVVRTSDSRLGNWALHSPQGSGINDRLQIASAITDLDMTGPYSVMAWIKSSNGTGGCGIVVLGSCCSDRQGYTLNLSNNGNQLRFWGGSTANNSNYNSYHNGSFATNQWVHVGYRVNNTSLQWRIDGANGTTSNISNIPTAPSMANPMNTAGATHNPQVGGQGIGVVGADVKIDEVRVYDKYLTDPEWTNAMNGL